ncbi:MAG: hypothetical protein EOP00_08315 [Pedobacter sp.]|nr:MAG: hypothetical protein EOP00_08315 [Pedobacter sp.]
MVEVFKTDVCNCDDAIRLIEKIHLQFDCYQANFDLDDCDHILRIKCSKGQVQAHPIIALLQHNGFNAEVLNDDFKPQNT